MGKMKKEEVKQATKDKIFKVAAELFSRDGYYKVSVREICEAAGVTKPVLYYYFEDKENLLLEMMRETRRIVKRLIIKHIESVPRFEEKLEGIIELYIDFIDEFPHLVQFSTFIQFMVVPERIKQYKHDEAKNNFEKLTSIFQEAQLKGELISKASTQMLVQNFLGSVIIIFSGYLMGQLDKNNFKKQLYEFLKFWKQQFLIDKN